MDKLQMYFIEIAKLFECKYDDFFFEYLNAISVPNTKKCGKEIKLGEGGWKCRDCEFESYSIYCNDCFIKEKHRDHNIFFNPGACGFCDCGESSILKPEGFCDKHTGDYNNINDLMKYIKLNIPENIIEPINLVLNNIFLLFIEKIKDLNEENGENEDELFKMFECLEIFCNKLYNNNLGLFYLVTLKFTENFPFETNHKCFSYDESKDFITFIKKDNDKKHICICPFLQVMIYVLMRRKTKQNSSTFFNLFLQTYINNIITSLTFFNCFSELFYNKNLESLRTMGFQLINENISISLFKEQNIPFLQNIFEEIFSTIKYFFDEKRYKDASAIFFRFYQIIKFLPGDSIIDKMNSNHNVLKIIIDICCLVNNMNVFENKIKLKVFQYEGYKIDLINIENYALLTTICLIHILDFNNQETINFVFKVIFEKLFEYKYYKNSLEEKNFTPHLFIIKCYSIFINRFCFFHSVKNECDLLDSFEHFQKVFPQSKELNVFLFVELINFFGFMISQHYNFFIYYGKDMADYYPVYSDSTYIFIKSDITLMKYLLTQPEIKEFFSLQKIVALSDIESSNDFFKNLSEENLNKSNPPLIYQEEKNLKYINSVIEFLYLIIRDNLSMENLVFRNVDFKWKMKDELFEYLNKIEKEKIQSLVKNEIIHFIVSQNNLVKRDNCVDYLERIFDENYIETLDEVLKNYCEKITLSNGLIEFSLKKNLMNLFDIDFIISFNKRTNTIEYIRNFQSKNYNELNINIIEPLDIKKKLMENIYQTFYNENILDELIKLHNLIYNYKEKFPLLNQIFYFNITKILSFAYKLCSTQFLETDFKMKILEKFSQIQDNEFINKLGENKQENTEELANKNSNKNLKEKLKKKFVRKNELIREQMNSANMDIDEETKKVEESCVYCLQPFFKDQNNFGYYGKICYYFSDKVTDILRKKPENERTKKRKFISCNHKIHFKCFNKFICLHFDKKSNEFQCPLCKKLSNIILFDFNILNKDSSLNDVLKGINYGNEKIILDEFYKEDIDSKYQILIYSNTLVFENYCSKLVKKRVLINDINTDINLATNIRNLLIDDFEEFTIYYTITNNKKEQIEIWKNILYNIKLLYQYKILTVSEESLKLLNLLQIDNIQNLEESLSLFSISNVINKFIIISIILFEPNEENKEKIKNYFYNNILPYLIYITYMKYNNHDLDEFITNNKEELKKAIDLFNVKYRICLLLFQEKEENINLTESLEEIISFIKSNSNFINLYQSKKNNFPQPEFLSIPEFKLVNIPERGIEFLNKANGDCIYCHKRRKVSYLCLFCGNKVCNNIYCLIQDEKQKEYSLIHHSKKCCGGNGIFLNISNAEIVYILKRKIIDSKIYVYMNNFGEPMKSGYLYDVYLLNRNELQKGINQFIDLTYRIKGEKIYYNNNNQNNENNEEED